MTEFLDKQSREHALEPLHQLLLGWVQWPGAKKEPRYRVSQIQIDQSYDLGEALISAHAREITVTQLVTSLKMQGMDDESAAMLGLLESLVLAGEISFRDFMGRVQNLFPRVMDDIDVSLRMKVASLMVD